MSERKTKARPLITCFKSGKELKHMEHPYKNWYIYILQHVISLIGIVFNFAESVPFAFLAYHSTQTESLLSFVDMPGSWGLVGATNLRIPSCLEVIMIWYISKRPEASTTHILYSIVDVFWICTPANHEVEIPWSYGSSMFFFSDPEVEMLELQVVAQPKVGVEASFSRNSVGKLRSWTLDAYQKRYWGIQFLLVSHILW